LIQSNAAPRRQTPVFAGQSLPEVHSSWMMGGGNGFPLTLAFQQNNNRRRRWKRLARRQFSEQYSLLTYLRSSLDCGSSAARDRWMTWCISVFAVVGRRAADQFVLLINLDVRPSVQHAAVRRSSCRTTTIASC